MLEIQAPLLAIRPALHDHQWRHEPDHLELGSQFIGRPNLPVLYLQHLAAGPLPVDLGLHVAPQFFGFVGHDSKGWGAFWPDEGCAGRSSEPPYKGGETMSTNKFLFQTLAELRAFEVGVWFSEAPVTTQIAGMALIVSDHFGAGVSEHDYAPAETMLPIFDLGDRILASRIVFQSTAEAAAFATGLCWYGAHVNIELNGMEVAVQQNRPDNEDDEMIAYEFEILRALIADHRAQTGPPSA